MKYFIVLSILATMITAQTTTITFSGTIKDDSGSGISVPYSIEQKVGDTWYLRGNGITLEDGTFTQQIGGITDVKDKSGSENLTFISFAKNQLQSHIPLDVELLRVNAIGQQVQKEVYRSVTNLTLPELPTGIAKGIYFQRINISNNDRIDETFSTRLLNITGKTEYSGTELQIPLVTAKLNKTADDMLYFRLIAGNENFAEDTTEFLVLAEGTTEVTFPNLTLNKIGEYLINLKWYNDIQELIVGEQVQLVLADTTITYTSDPNGQINIDLKNIKNPEATLRLILPEKYMPKSKIRGIKVFNETDSVAWNYNGTDWSKDVEVNEIPINLDSLQNLVKQTPLIIESFLGQTKTNTNQFFTDGIFDIVNDPLAQSYFSGKQAFGFKKDKPLFILYSVKDPFTGQDADQVYVDRMIAHMERFLEVFYEPGLGVNDYNIKLVKVEDIKNNDIIKNLENQTLSISFDSHNTNSQIYKEYESGHWYMYGAEAHFQTSATDSNIDEELYASTVVVSEAQGLPGYGSIVRDFSTGKTTETGYGNQSKRHRLDYGENIIPKK